jgi:iodotyrosine deiodinase
VTAHDGESFVPYALTRWDAEEMLARSAAFAAWLHTRRSVRVFSPEPVPLEAIRRCIDAAASAPSGAHKQPWTFCLVTDPVLKAAIRSAAEAEEYQNYHGRMSESWLQDLKPFGTNHLKPFIEEAPALIVVFKQIHDTASQGGKKPNYYVSESVGISVGMLLAALHHIGLVALTHTPSPMGFLAEILDRPSHERAFLNIPVGFPAKGVQVPDLQRKRRGEYLVEY